MTMGKLQLMPWRDSSGTLYYIPCFEKSGKLIPYQTNPSDEIVTFSFGPITL